MPITQTSLKSKNYNALGIDEIADDITNIITEVNILSAGGSGSDYTETIVNISSAQILAWTTPYNLLTNAGAGNYYDWYMVLEYTAGVTAYTGATVLNIVSSGGNTLATIDAYLIGDTVNQIAIVYPAYNNGGVMMWSSDTLNSGLQIASNALADGDGTLRVKIYHKTITFGA